MGTFCSRQPQRTIRLLLIILSLFSAPCLVRAQVHEQHPYRQITFRTRVNVQSSREKDAKYRYSPWGNLYSSDRRYSQKVRLDIAVTNVSGSDLKNIKALYRIYKRNLSQDIHTVAAAGEVVIPEIRRNETKNIVTDAAECQYRLLWNSLVRGNRLSRSGEKYAGYVVIYSDSKGPVCWDMSSETMYAEYARELRNLQHAQSTASSSNSREASTLPYSATTVCVTKTGRKFHRDSCRFVRTDKRSLSRDDALKSGYTPCSVCNP